jgi:hypothetical protein
MSQSQPTFCIKCGKQLASGAVFCAYCGTPVVTEKNSQPLSTLPAADHRMSRFYFLSLMGCVNQVLWA